MFRYLILGLLRTGGAHHGYALMRTYRERAGMRVSTGNFYREFRRLVADGLLEITVDPLDTDARRTRYRISEAGATAFDTWLLEPNGRLRAQHEDELSARALFVTDGQEDAVSRILDAWQSELWAYSKTLEHTRKAVEAALAKAPNGEFPALPHLLSRRQKHVAVDVEFIEKFKAAHAQWVATKHGLVRARRRPLAPAATKRRPIPVTRKAARLE